MSTIVVEHKYWNTKKFITGRDIHRIYRHCPKYISFKSPMVSDENQELCAGGGAEKTRITTDRLINRKKPFGSLHYWEQQEAEMSAAHLQSFGLKTRIERCKTVTPGETYILYTVLVAQDMNVADIGDIKLLEADYQSAGIAINTSRYTKKPLSYYFRGWDVEDIPMWLTGLILGYPIENTIAIYKEVGE